MKKNSNCSAGYRFRFAMNAWLFVVAVFFWAPSARAQPKLCFPNNSWFASPTPDITKDIHSDPGWNGAFTYDPLDGVVIRGITDGNNLFFSVEAKNLDSLSSSTGATSSLVALAFDPVDGTSTHRQLALVFPVNLATPFNTVTPVNSFEYWPQGLPVKGINGSDVPPANIPPPPQWFLDNTRVTYYQDGTLFRWALAMKIPVANTPNSSTTATNSDHVQIPSPPTVFGLYLDVFRVIAGAYVQTSWQNNAAETGCPDPAGCSQPEVLIPASSQWGIGTLDKTSCGGASITLAPPNYDNILAGTIDPGTLVFTEHSPNSKIALNEANTFRAYIQNTSIDASSGTAVSIPAQVTATFQITNFGMGGGWIPVPTDSGVSTATKTIDATACTGATNNRDTRCLVQIGPWNLTTTPNGGQQAAYNTPTTNHQCIQVSLEPASGSNTIILNNLAQRNFDFGIASKFERTAEIRSKGYPPRLNPDGTNAPDQEFDLRVITSQQVLKSHSVNSSNKLTGTQQTRDHEGNHEGEVISQLTWIVEGCRHTGRYMTIKNQTLELCETVGRFGYLVRHTGTFPVKKWNLAFTGQGVEKVPGTDNLYRLHVANDQATVVKTDIEPEEPRWAVFLDAGGGFPQGTFKNAFNNGFTLNAGLEYMINNRFSAEGIFGYHHFPAKVGSNQNIYQFSGNAKVYLTTPRKVRPFVNFGPGGYAFSPGSTNFGGNFGGGVLLQLSSRFGLQGSYNFHVVNTAGGATKFSTVQGGFRLVL